MGDSTHPMMQQAAAPAPSSQGAAENLQEKVSGAVHAAEAAACGAAAAIKEGVRGASEGVKDAAQSVAHAVDIRSFVQDHPWLAVGGSIAVGFLASELLRASSRSGAAGSWAGYPSGPGGEREPGQALPAAGESLGKMASWLGEQLDEVKSFAAGSVMNYVHSLVARGLDSIEEGLRAQGDSDHSRDTPRPYQPNEPTQGAHP